MRMPIALSTLLAVVCGAVASAGDLLVNVSRVRRAPHRIMTDEESWKRTYWREMQSILRQPTSEDKNHVECCPSIEEMVAPKGGKSQSGLFSELYEDGENKQQFYEISCAPGVVNRPCRFIDARLYNQSRCVQKYSYSYALVRNPAVTQVPHHRLKRDGHFSVPGSGDWSLDYVLVRSGCECQITPPQKRRSAHKKAGVTKRPERHRARKKIRRFEEFGET